MCTCEKKCKECCVCKTIINYSELALKFTESSEITETKLNEEKYVCNSCLEKRPKTVIKQLLYTTYSVIGEDR